MGAESDRSEETLGRVSDQSGLRLVAVGVGTGGGGASHRRHTKVRSANMGESIRE